MVNKEFEESEKGVQDLLSKLISNKGKNSVDYYHKKLGKIMWIKCGMSRNQNDLVDAINELEAKTFYFEGFTFTATASLLTQSR